MKKLSPIQTLLFQLFVTYAVLLIVYLYYAQFDIDDNNDNPFAFFLFQPIFGFIVSSITVAACLIVGLPIRLIKRLKQWWYTKPVIPLLGVAIGLVLLLLAFYPACQETWKVVIDGEPTQKQVPNIVLSRTGWFVTAFFLLHFYPQSALYLSKGKS
ncbi:MAG TPA: hypothetical protein VNS32_09275 [Flavisolibacter sp.]|nr:hypothetical protein [Flavisolibacter sp.]